MMRRSKRAKKAGHAPGSPASTAATSWTSSSWLWGVPLGIVSFYATGPGDARPALKWARFGLGSGLSKIGKEERHGQAHQGARAHHRDGVEDRGQARTAG